MKPSFTTEKLGSAALDNSGQNPGQEPRDRRQVLPAVRTGEERAGGGGGVLRRDGGCRRAGGSCSVSGRGPHRRAQGWEGQGAGHEQGVIDAERLARRGLSMLAPESDCSRGWQEGPGLSRGTR